MPSRTTSKERRAALPRRVEYAKSFVKDWDRYNRAGKLDMHRFKEVMTLIFLNDRPLGPEWSDHALAGEWRDHRECHVGGDVLLIPRVAGDDGVIFVRTGSHAALFE